PTSRAAPSPTLLPYTTLFRSGTALAEPRTIRSRTDTPPWCRVNRAESAWLSCARRSEQALGRPPLAGGSKREQIKMTPDEVASLDRKSTRLNSSHVKISYAVF